MIRAVIFDLDDVLVQTERLKAISYARAISLLCPGVSSNREITDAYRKITEYTIREEDDTYICNISEPDVVETYKDNVGRSRKDMAEGLIARFGLEPYLEKHMKDNKLSEPWQALIHVRMPIYESIVADSEVVRSSIWPHNVALMRAMRERSFLTGLATMSERKHVLKIIDAIGLTDLFDCIITGEDVSQGKPDPEIYRLVSQRLNMRPSQCLVIEDSPSGIKAGLSAGMWVIAVTTPFSRDKVLAADILDKQWVVDNPNLLPAVFDRMIQERTLDVER